MALKQRRHKNIATVAQANKYVRIAWAIRTRKETYRADHQPTLKTPSKKRPANLTSA